MMGISSQVKLKNLVRAIQADKAELAEVECIGWTPKSRLKNGVSLGAICLSLESSCRYTFVVTARAGRKAGGLPGPGLAALPLRHQRAMLGHVFQKRLAPLRVAD